VFRVQDISQYFDFLMHPLDVDKNICHFTLLDKFEIWSAPLEVLI